MAKLKRLLAGTLAVCMAGSMALMTSCGDSDDDSGTASGSAGSTNSGSSDNGDGDSERVNTAELHGTESSDESKNTLTIYCWNTEFKERLDAFYPSYGSYDVTTSTYTNDDGEEVVQVDTIDGVTINWVQIENEGNAYQTTLDEALSSQQESTEKVDMFLAEADYALKYVNGDVALSIQDIGITDDDLANQYQYTIDVATDTTTGEVKGVSWQATPGLFLYNTVYAEQVLGTSDPDEVQEYVKDWDTFAETAELFKAEGIAMLSGYDDAYRVFGANISAPNVDSDGVVQFDQAILDWINQTKTFTDSGYNHKTSLWGDDWAADQLIDGETFGFFYSTWGIDFTLSGYTGEDGYGKWRACEGPEGWYWGGTWILGAIDSDNTDIVADIMKTLTCNTECMKDICQTATDYVNNKAAIEELISEGYTSDFLGGQDYLTLLSASADKIDLSGKLSAYDQGYIEQLQAAMKSYYDGSSTAEEAVEAFKTGLTALYSNLDVSGLTADGIG